MEIALYFSIIGGFIAGFAVCCWLSPIDSTDWGEPKPKQPEEITDDVPHHLRPPIE